MQTLPKPSSSTQQTRRDVALEDLFALLGSSDQPEVGALLAHLRMPDRGES